MLYVSSGKISIKIFCSTQPNTLDFSRSWSNINSFFFIFTARFKDFFNKPYYFVDIKILTHFLVVCSLSIHNWIDNREYHVDAVSSTKICHNSCWFIDNTTSLKWGFLPQARKVCVRFSSHFRHLLIVHLILWFLFLNFLTWAFNAKTTITE